MHESFDLRPPRRWPPMIDGLRRSLHAGPGRIARLWFDEADAGDGSPPRLLLAAELLGREPLPVTDEERQAVRDDLLGRVAEMSDGPPDPIGVVVFGRYERGDLPEYFRDLEPVYGEPERRFMNMAAMRRLLPAPRELPPGEEVNKDQSKLGDVLLAGPVLLAIAVGIGWLALWLVPLAWLGWAIGVVAVLTAVVLTLFMYLGSVERQVRKAAPMARANPLVLGSIVQAFEALWVPRHEDYPHGARFGLVVVYSLDAQRRDDLGYLTWLARRLAWLRDNGAQDADEGKVVRRLEAEADDGTSRLPPGLTGNDATYWASPMITRDDLPGERLPGDRVLPLLLEKDATAGAETVRLERLWPAELWPLRSRPPWAERPDYPEETAVDVADDDRPDDDHDDPTFDRGGRVPA